MQDREALKAARRVVVKVGTAVVARPDGGMALGRLGSLVEQVHGLLIEGREVVLVSSGAVGLGVQRLGLEKAPTSRIERQACAAAGQGALVGLYEHLFAKLGHRVAQVLLTESDLSDRRRHVNLAATLERLLELGAVPVINENDVVSDSLGPFGRVFEDNDRLAALVASALGCDAVVLLTDVPGVLTAPPGTPGAERIPVLVDQDYVVGAGTQMGRGGIQAKVDAARIAAASGCAAVIASGHDPDVVGAVFAGDDVGTLVPATDAHNRRRRWLAFASLPEGRLEIDAGARSALVERNASLLAVGVSSVVGDFAAGTVVSIVHDGAEIGRGICSVSAEEARRKAAEGGRGKPLVHRDDAVILEGT